MLASSRPEAKTPPRSREARVTTPGIVEPKSETLVRNTSL